MDFLGLRTLTVIQQALGFVKDRTGYTVDFDAMSYDDPKVFELIASGRTEGIFQLESGGFKTFMKELKPHDIEDVIAGISLYRPGPMDFIPQYIQGKQNQDSVTYLCPELEPILKPTYGCIVYQEQVMQIVRDLGGYTLGRSDLVRRAMSKKKESVMQKERQNFVYGNAAEGVPGCLSRGIPEDVAHQIFDRMTDFARYAFNRSHAAAYAFVAYETAYLKLYYPVEFMAALMTSVMDVSSKVSEYTAVCRQMGIRILPPDINEGTYGFSPSGNAIRYGLSAIRGVGRSVVDLIAAERDRGGPFSDLEDFLSRMNVREINKRTVENFILAGAMDTLPGFRSQKMAVYGDIMEKLQREKKDHVAGQMSLFDLFGGGEIGERTIFPDIPEYPRSEKLRLEKEVLGLYVSGHPLEEEEERLRRNVTARLSDFTVDEESGAAGVADGSTVIVGGLVQSCSFKNTRNGKTMAVATLEDMTDTVEIMFFPRECDSYRDQLTEGNRVFVRGRVSIGDDPKGKLICERLLPFSGMQQELFILFEDKEDYRLRERQLMHLLRGEPAVIYLRKERQLTDDVIAEIRETFGEKKVALKEKKVEEIWKTNYNYTAR